MDTKLILLTAFSGFLVGQVAASDITGHVTTKGARGKGSVMVYIQKVEQEFPPPKEPAVMNQKNLAFHPHILPITVGSTVKFMNSDDVLHNVFTPDACAEKINLGTWPKGESRTYTFNEEGCISVMLCNVHPEMEAWILVLQNPYYVEVSEDGTYTIKDVPAGTYKVVAWHERLKSKTQAVVVPAEGQVQADFALSRR